MNDEQTHDRTPPDDPVFAHLAAEPVANRLPVCRAMIEPAALRRHDRRHRPELRGPARR